jgi:ketosteroid isomerase-like protein
MIQTVSQHQAQLADREAIRDCLYLYARAVDRCDAELLREVYWPDAIDHHLDFSGTVAELVAWAIPRIRAMELGMHSISNILIRVNGAHAQVESYYHGIHTLIGPEGARRDIVATGRYLDRFERRDDRWKIAERTVVTDYFRDYPDAPDWSVGPFGMQAARGARHPQDMSYELFARSR